MNDLDQIAQDKSKFPISIEDGKMVEERTLRTAPLCDLTIDQVISHRLNDVAIFGRVDEESQRKYWIGIRSDVRTRRMIEQITNEHVQIGFYQASAVYVSVQHGRMIDYVKHATYIKQINDLYADIEKSNNVDLKDERDTPTVRFIKSPYRGGREAKSGFILRDAEEIKTDASRRGIAVSTYNTICSILSCRSSNHISTDCIDVCNWYTRKYQAYLDDRIRDLERIVDGS